MIGPFFLYIIPVPILDRCLDGSRRGEDTWGIEEDGTGTGRGRLLEFFKSGDREIVADEGTRWVRFLGSKLPVGRTTGVDTVLSLTNCEPEELPKELDLSIDELVASFNGLGPLETDCARGGRSSTPNSAVFSVLLSDGLVFNVRETGVDGREDGDRRRGSECVVSIVRLSLGGNGGGSESSSSRVGGSRGLDDEPVLSVLLRVEGCLIHGKSAETVLCVLERGEGSAAGCDRIEATDEVRDSAIDESRRVRGDGESSSSLNARVNVNNEASVKERPHTYHSTLGP